MDWIDVAQDWHKCWAVMISAPNLEVPWSGGDVLSSKWTDCLSRTPLQGVCALVVVSESAFFKCHVLCDLLVLYLKQNDLTTSQTECTGYVRHRIKTGKFVSTGCYTTAQPYSTVQSSVRLQNDKWWWRRLPNFQQGIWHVDVLRFVCIVSA